MQGAVWLRFIMGATIVSLMVVLLCLGISSGVPEGTSLTPGFVAAGLEYGLTSLGSASAEIELKVSFPSGRDIAGTGKKLREILSVFKWAIEDDKLGLELLRQQVLVENEQERRTLDSQYRFVVTGTQAYCYSNNALLEVAGLKTRAQATIGDVVRIASREGFSPHYPEADPRWWGWYYATQKLSSSLSPGLPSGHRIVIDQNTRNDDLLVGSLKTESMQTTFWLDTTRNFMLRKVVEETVFGSRSSKTFFLEVSEIADTNQIYLPIDALRVLYGDNNEIRSAVTLHVRDLAVGGHVPDEFFEFSIPQGCRVLDWSQANIYTEGETQDASGME